MKKPLSPSLHSDTHAMEEIGFIYVLALSILLLSAIFFTIRDTTETKKESSTLTYYENTGHQIAGVVQDVLNMEMKNPGINYTRLIRLRHPDDIYQYWINFNTTSVTLKSRVKTITVSVNIYNPQGIDINEKVSGDVEALSLTIDKQTNKMVIEITDY